jgi:ureidoglycolate hydrolase
MVAIVTIDAEPLTAAAWAPFGWLPVADTDPADGAGTLAFAWADPHLNVIAHAHGEVEWSADGARCTVFYRHRTHTQALTPLDHPSIIAVAPAELDFSLPEHLDAVRAFRLEPLDTVVLGQGTWHWGPFPIGPDPVRLLNVQGRRYREDNDRVDLPATVEGLVEVRATL